MGAPGAKRFSDAVDEVLDAVDRVTGTDSRAGASYRGAPAPSSSSPAPFVAGRALGPGVSPVRESTDGRGNKVWVVVVGADVAVCSSEALAHRVARLA